MGLSLPEGYHSVNPYVVVDDPNRHKHDPSITVRALEPYSRPALGIGQVRLQESAPLTSGARRDSLFRFIRQVVAEADCARLCPLPTAHRNCQRRTCAI
jgi:hypothetical protein